MKITVDQVGLSTALQKLQSITPVRVTGAMPILQNVLLESTEKGLYCTATNGEIATKIFLDGVFEQAGKTTVNCRKLANLIKTLNKSNQIELEQVTNDRIQILSGKGKYKLATLDPEEFLDIPDSDNITFKIPDGNLRAALMDTDFAASTEEVRYILNGVCLTFEDGKIEFAACDVKKVAVSVYEEDLDEDISQIVIPLKACKEIQKVFTNDEEISVCVEDNYLTLFTDTYRFFARTVSSNDNKYPNYRQLFAFEDENVIIANKEQLENAIKRVSSVRDDSDTVNLSINQEENTLDVKAEAGEYDAYEPVEIDGKTADLDFQINYKFLSEVLEHLNCENIMISMAPDNQRITLKCPDKDYQYYMIALVQSGE